MSLKLVLFTVAQFMTSQASIHSKGKSDWKLSNKLCDIVRIVLISLMAKSYHTSLGHKYPQEKSTTAWFAQKEMNENALFLNHGFGTNATAINCLGLAKQLRGKNIR